LLERQRDELRVWEQPFAFRLRQHIQNVILRGWDIAAIARVSMAHDALS
jgi:hypothetical protein